MNPPYCGSLHLKILENVIKSLPEAEIVCLHPVYIDFINDKVKDYGLKLEVASHLKDSDFVRFDQANDLFGIAFTDLLIGLYTGDTKVKPQLSPVFYLLKKMSQKGTTLSQMWSKDKLYKAAVATIYTNSNVARQTPLLSENGSIAKSGYKEDKSKFNWVSFNTEEELNNFKSLFSSTFYGVFLSAIFDHKMQGRQINNFPIPDDYTHPWTDADLYKYFNLTEEEIKVIETTMEQYK